MKTGSDSSFWTSLFLPAGIPAFPSSIHPILPMVHSPTPEETPSPCGPLSPIHAAGHPCPGHPCALQALQL